MHYEGFFLKWQKKYVYYLHNHCIIIIIIIREFFPRAGSSLRAQKPKLQFCRKQVFHRKLRKQGCSFIWEWIGAVATRYPPHPTLSVASEQTLKDLKRSQGTNVEVRRAVLAKWALRNSPKWNIMKYKGTYLGPIL